MLRIFKYPFESRNEIAKKMLIYSLFASLMVLISVIPMFVFISRDSAKNRDAARKITSQETELSVLLVFVTFLLCIVFISIMGIRLSRKVHRNFEKWVSFNGYIYYIKASVPRGTNLSNPKHINAVTKSQDRVSDYILNEKNIHKLLTSGQKPQGMTIFCADGAKILKQGKCSVVHFEDGRKVKIYKDIIDYDILINQLDTQKGNIT